MHFKITFVTYYAFNVSVMLIGSSIQFSSLFGKCSQRGCLWRLPWG